MNRFSVITEFRNSIFHGSSYVHLQLDLQPIVFRCHIIVMCGVNGSSPTLCSLILHNSDLFCRKFPSCKIIYIYFQTLRRCETDSEKDLSTSVSTMKPLTRRTLYLEKDGFAELFLQKHVLHMKSSSNSGRVIV